MGKLTSIAKAESLYFSATPPCGRCALEQNWLHFEIITLTNCSRIECPLEGVMQK